MAPTKTDRITCNDPRCDDKNDHERQLFYCADCKSCLCDKCWRLQPTHASSEHEQLKYSEYLQCTRLEKMLHMPTTEEDLEELHTQDRNTIWFGESYKLPVLQPCEAEETQEASAHHSPGIDRYQD